MKHLLFVDDEPLVLEGFSRMLRPERAEWVMHRASGVEEALEVLGRQEFDAIVSDYNMPGQNGFALLAAVRASQTFGDVPVIIVTGSSDSGLKRAALELGATDLLSKPVEREDLIARLRNVLRLKEFQDTIMSQNLRLEHLVEERTAQLAASRHEIIWRLAKAAESRDQDTGNHVVRVGCSCRIVAEQLNMPDDFVEHIFLASPLHDIGKIGIPDRILLKPARFEPDEWEIMKTHAQLGADILCHDLEIIGAINSWAPASLANTPMLCENPVLEMAATIALAHHEKWDGSGYPNGIAGEDIPLAARIVAVADVFDALSSERPYKKAMSEEEVLKIMREGNGSHFDPVVLDAFIDSLPRIREMRQHFADVFEASAAVAA